jgi:hypothetical protein
MSIIPASQEVEIRRIIDQGEPGQKVGGTTISTKKPGVVGHSFNPSYEEGIGERIVV